MFQSGTIGYIESLDIGDWLLFLLYFIVILGVSWIYALQKRKKDDRYRWFFKALMLKMVASIGFSLVYVYVYKGGDTVTYFENARANVNLLASEPLDFFSVYFSPPSPEKYYLYNSDSGYPWYYIYAEAKTGFVVKLITPLVLLSMTSFLGSNLLMAFFTFWGMWRFFLLISELYPKYTKGFFIGIFLLPSVAFWGSGMLKDSITLSAACWFLDLFYRVLIQRKFSFKKILQLLISVYLILTIKPYIIIALLPGALIWFFHEPISRIQKALFRYFLIPFVFFFSLIGGYFIMTTLFDWKIEDLLKEAYIKYDDLKRDYYQGNSFDIGFKEPTIEEALRVAPAAITAGLFRPFLWESRNVVMLFSGVENFVVLFLFIYLLLRTRITGMIRAINDHPFVFFAFTYSVLFALLVGLSTSNFGALVRFKIAFLPFFYCALVILNGETKRKRIEIVKRKSPGKSYVQFQNSGVSSRVI
jgi:hypothetical protein